MKTVKTAAKALGEDGIQQNCINMPMKNSKEGCYIS